LFVGIHIPFNKNNFFVMFLTQKNSDKIVTFFYCYGKWLICSMFFVVERAMRGNGEERVCWKFSPWIHIKAIL
jgi:hypothetical protein